MSDHEGEGLDLDRWEEASLPGASIYSYAASDVFNQGIGSGEANLHPPTGPRYGTQRNYVDQARRIRFPETSHRPPQYLAAYANSGSNGLLYRPRPVAGPPAPKSTAELRFEAGQPANGEHQFASTWKTFRTMALRIDRAAQPHPLQQLQEMMSNFSTFIKRPDDQDDRIFIWGDPQPVEETKTALAQWEEDVRNSFQTNGVNRTAWAKSYALDGRAEHRLERQTRKQAFNELLKQVDIDYPVEAAILWPKDLDMEEFESFHAEVFDQLRSSFPCRIDFQTSDMQYIEISAYTEVHIAMVKSRILNLVKETVSRKDQLLTVTLIHLPDYSIYRDRVGLQDKDPRTDSYLPTLHGVPAADEEELAKERRTTHLNNRKKVRKTLDSSLKRLRLSQHHVRMRVVFGELGFTLFQKPAEGADTYAFEDFYAMVTKGRTKLNMNSLPVRQGDVIDLPDILDSMDAFVDRTEFYGAFLDFPAASSHTLLRLETVIFPVGEAGFEIREKRWVEFGDMVSRLQIGLINFERPDYQITLDAFPLHSNKSLKAHMAAFQNDISFERPPDGIKSVPRRRVKYPSGHSGLSNVSELIVVRWRFKQTDGIFELRRKDVYDERPGRRSPGPIRSSWHALYYYPEWDNLLGEFATVKPGEDVSWVKSAATFFPESNNDDGRALPQGFKNFITEVEEIQDLLAEAISKVAKGNQNAEEEDRDEEHQNGV
ncbi:uncharacterized protein Z518_05162 [Rhinocladiella mackenziei CBS 650.93]|uniref:DUF7905 domain-containing protein n=1 Tax=Rhinocladiella mackenziei CBS 650.93 TaxID=1442369 RepID=A0A0D2J5H6_9EURO|nr:uncharacterized protein Z518_05162 [Rhinocladiella mackenziei CBS 650.93]KIX04295.1 hypothetical protein Z518_05162 [Rhinocladiella mackenziei CBS 650.93]